MITTAPSDGIDVSVGAGGSVVPGAGVSVEVGVLDAGKV
jgi:hypothetical protein